MGMKPSPSDATLGRSRAGTAGWLVCAGTHIVHRCSTRNAKLEVLCGYGGGKMGLDGFGETVFGLGLHCAKHVWSVGWWWLQLGWRLCGMRRIIAAAGETNTGAHTRAYVQFRCSVRLAIKEIHTINRPRPITLRTGERKYVYVHRIHIHYGK